MIKSSFQILVKLLTLNSNQTAATNPSPPLSAKSQALSLIFGGLLPVIAFTVIEEYYGIIAGLLAGMIFGVGEIIFEWVKYRKVSTITWIGNSMLLGLGGISLISQEGIWFKLQPALMEFFFFIFLLASWIMKKPFLKLMIEKQNPNAPTFVKENLSGMTLRLSFFFLAHAILATWAAFYWSTEAWAWLKGAGVMISMIIYMVLEAIWLRRRNR